MPYKRLKILKGFIDRGIGPFLKQIYGLGIRPIHLTLLSLPCGLLGVWFLFIKPFLSAFFVFSYIALDVLDGTMARATGTTSEFGQKMDFLIDRAVASFFLIILYFRTGEFMLPVVGLTAVVLFSLEDLGLIKR
jgi:phosphatidylglycerophosphate synthase